LIKDRIAFVQVNEPDTSHDFMKQLSNQFPILVKVTSSQGLDDLLATKAINGITLNGSQEIKPGLKDYTNLADVLEQLDVD
jgi:phosphoribosylanthranilate isomerase